MLLLKRLASRLPDPWQAELKRIHFARQIARNTFATHEPEYKILHQLVNAGDWVIDIGANVGHYTKRLSELVGKDGRVIAFEPIPATFALLSANAQHFAHPNVTLINAAVSDKVEAVGMSIPAFSSGLTNYYEAKISSAADTLAVLTLSIDTLRFPHRIALIKADVEGHEAFVLAGMRGLIEKDHPILIVETGSQTVIDGLTSLGYVAERLPDSPNVLFRPGG